MDPFAVVLVFGLVALILWVVLLGKYAPGSGLDQIGWKSARQVYETREALDAEDLQQMLQAHNARRRARGESEVTVEELEMRVVNDLNEQRRRQEELMAERDLDELLETTNARRRAKGLPERTREDVRREFGAGGEERPRGGPERPGAGEERPGF